MAEIDFNKLGDVLDSFLGDENVGNPVNNLLEQIIRDWWNNKVNPQIARTMDDRKINASGGLKASFKPGEIIKTPTSINTILVADDYWEFVEYGRKPTRNGHIEGTPYLWQSIKEWIRAKPIAIPQNMTHDSLAKAIAKKIHRRGTKANPFLEDAFTESLQMELVNELNARLGDLIFAVEVKS